MQTGTHSTTKTSDVSVYNQRWYTETEPKIIADRQSHTHKGQWLVSCLMPFQHYLLMTICIYITGHIQLHVLHNSAPVSAFPLCIPPAPQNQYTASVLTVLQDQSRHPHADQKQNRLDPEGARSRWTHTHNTYRHKEGNNEVPHDEHHTNSPWRLGKEKLSLSSCRSSLSIQSISFI